MLDSIISFSPLVEFEFTYKGMLNKGSYEMDTRGRFAVVYWSTYWEKDGYREEAIRPQHVQQNPYMMELFKESK